MSEILVDREKVKNRLIKTEAQVTQLAEQLKSAQGYLKLFEEIIDKGELTKFREWIETQYTIEAQNETNKLRAEITAENPVPKKAKKEVNNCV